MQNRYNLKRLEALTDYYLVSYSLLVLLSLLVPKFHFFVRSEFFLALTFSILLLEKMIVKYKKRDGKRKRATLYALFLLLTITMFINGSGIGSVLQYSSIVLLMNRDKRISISKKASIAIIMIFLSINLFLIYESFTGYYSLYISQRKITEMVNPNHYGVITVYISTVLAVWIYLRSSIYKVVWVNVYLALNIFVLYFLETRASLLALTVYIIVLNLYLLYLERDDFRSKYCLKRLFLILLLLVFVYPLIMSGLYFIFGESQTLSSKGKLFSKAIFSGRERIWTNFYTNVFSSYKNILFGLGTNYAFVTNGTAKNIHHSFLNIYNNHGLVLFVFYINNLYNKWFGNFKYHYNSNTKGASVLLSIGIFSAIVVGAFEITFSSYSYGVLYLIYFSGIRIGKRGKFNNYNVVTR